MNQPLSVSPNVTAPDPAALPQAHDPWTCTRKQLGIRGERCAVNLALQVVPRAFMGQGRAKTAAFHAKRPLGADS